MSCDALLREVNDAFASLAKQLDLLHPQCREDLVRHSECREEPIRLPRGKQLARFEQLIEQFLLLEWRSRDVRNEFAEFYCVRLLLDHQSPLASYFIDLFSQLHWMLWELHETYLGSWPTNLARTRSSRSWPNLVRTRSSILELTSIIASTIGPAIGTCRLLYAVYRMRPRSRTLQGLDKQRTDQFKREGISNGRRFTRNEPHCRLRELGLVNLDRQGPSMVHLSAQLGQGGSAAVYRGDFKSNDENGNTINIGDPVAVKMFSNSNSDSTEFSSQFWQSMEHMTQHPEQSCIDQFTSELGRLVSVRHPNIVILRGYIGERPEGESGLVMELMDESLHDYLEKVKMGHVPALQEFDMLDLMLEIAKGMQYLHECNLVHRDLKPQNVLLRLCTRDHKMQGCKFLEVKLADFGLTKLCAFAEDGSTMYTKWQGTSCYMAPELRVDAPLQESPADEIEKVDVFSYGTTCLNILLGNPNALDFSSQSIGGFYEAVKTGKWKQWVRHIDERKLYIVKLIARCWEWEPARRPTFAALCVLLQHTRAFLLSDQNLHSFQSQIRDILQTLQRIHKFQYSYVYRSIINKCLVTGAVRGVKLIGQCLHDLEPNMSSLESDFAQDVSILLEKGYFEAYFTAIERPESPESSESSKYPESPESSESPEYSKYRSNLNKLNDAVDPILFIKGLACCKMAMKHDTSKRRIKNGNWVSKMGMKHEFKNDGAFCELEVDESVIPLLVTFWSISDILTVNEYPDS